MANSVAVQNAINRRAMGGMPTPQLSAVTPNMPMASGSLPGNIPQSAMTKSSAMPSQPKQPSQKYQPQNQSDMITQALVEQLKSNNQLEKEKLKVATGGQAFAPSTPQVPQFNQTPPQNSGNIFGAPSMAVSQQQGGNPLSAGPF